MTVPRSYPSDLSDARWDLIEPTLTVWRSERRGRGLDIGRPCEHDLRTLMNAILYVDRTGIPWRYLPHDFLPVTWNHARWEKDGLFEQLNGLLRRLVREADGRNAEPSACVLDSQSIKTAASVSDNAAGIHLLSRIAAGHPRIAKAWADSGYRTTAIDHGARLGIDVHVVQRAPGTKGFKVLPRSWIVERSFGWLMHHRRLARDYETHPLAPKR